MNTLSRNLALVLVIAVVVGSSACGSEDESTSAAVATTEASIEGHDDNDGGEDHEEDNAGDEDHDDADHDDEDHDDDHADSTGGFGAHEHGVAELSVAWSEGDVIIDLISPTYNIFGFEHEPSTDEELALVAERTDALSEPGVLTINAEAGCDLADDVVTELESKGATPS